MSHLVRPFRVLARCLVLAAVAVGIAALALPPLPAQGVSSATTRLDWGIRAPMLIARSGHGLAAAPNGKLYAVGGYDGTNFLNSVEEYDPATDSWTTKAPMKNRRVGPGVAVAPNGKLYAAGGRDDVTRIFVTEEYDPATNTWTDKAAIPTHREAFGFAAAANGKLYAVGGFGTVRLVEEYDPATDGWRTATGGVGQLQVDHGGGIAVAAAPNGKLYATGGLGASITTAVEEYDPSTNAWTVKEPMGTRRYLHGLAASANGKLYAVGGFPLSGITPLNTVEEYDPARDDWRNRASLPRAPRLGLGFAAAPNGKLYAVGGGTNGTVGGVSTTVPIPFVDEYEPLTDTWTTPPPRAPLPAPARFRAATAGANGFVYVFGGQDDSGNVLREVQQYNPTTDTWEKKADMPTARAGAAAVQAPNGNIYVLNGTNASGVGYALLEEFTPPTNGVGLGSWKTAPAIAQPASPSADQGFALGANGRLYAASGAYFPSAGGGFVNGSTEEYRPAVDPFAGGGTWRDVEAAPAPAWRYGFAMARAGDNKLYAVGGDPGVPASTTLTRVDRFTPPTSMFDDGSWEGPTTVAQLPEPRAFLGLVGAPNGNLYAVGGRITTTDPDLRHKADVFEYDHLANAWTRKASMPTARRAMSLALVGNRLFAIGGFNRVGLSVNEEAVLDTLPTGVSARGPYTVRAGESVQISAAGSDPDGDPLSFAWDLDGDLLYETAGQSPTIAAPNKPNGTYPLRVRALDSKGGYAVASTMLTITCGPRPSVQTQRVGPGQIRAVVRAGQGSLTGALSIGPPGKPILNATVDVQGGPSGIVASQDVPVSGSEVVLTVTRREGGAVTVPLAITDGCGAWQTFVGFGPGV
jgi:N-acetylneuraminic acid mutarotase